MNDVWFTDRLARLEVKVDSLIKTDDRSGQ